MPKKVGEQNRKPQSPARPLPELSSDALLTLTRIYEDAGAGDDPPPSLTMWSGFLRGLRPEGITVKDLTRELRISKRAVVAWLSAAARWGYLSLERPGPPRVGDLIRVTDKWRSARDEWTSVEKAASKAWTKQVGAQRAKELRTALEELVARFALEMPHYPVSYGSADWTMTGGRYRPGDPGPPRIPPHGADWSPVVREEGDTVSRLALPALVSQALANFQIDGESAGCYPQLVIDILRRVPSKGMPTSDAPALAHVGGDSHKSGFVRHGILKLEGSPGKKRVRLTALAERVLSAYEPGAAKVESGWRDEYGVERVDRLRAALEAVAPSLDPPSDPPHHLWVVWEAGHAFVEATQTKRP